MAKISKPSGGTSGAGGDKSNTKTASNTRTATATKTSTEALTQGNFTATVTGGAGAGDTHVFIGGASKSDPSKMGTSKVKIAKNMGTSKGKIAKKAAVVNKSSGSVPAPTPMRNSSHESRR